LQPDLTGERRFGTSAEDEKADWRWVGAKTLDCDVRTCAWRVEGVSEGCSDC
jgi:hypothetical protein